MKTLILAAIRCALMFLLPTVTYAISTQWDLDPISGDWNTAANWTPNRVPNGPADIATFGLSNTSDVSISANTEVNSIIFTPAATNAYTITASPKLTLTISGVGIINNSGATQNFVTEVDGAGNHGQIVLTNNATAANGKFANNGSAVFGAFGGQTEFFDNSTAGSATINNNLSNNLGNGGETFFHNSSTAGSATITNSGGQTEFFDNSTAGSATIHNNAGNNVVVSGGRTFFHNSSTAGSATIINSGGMGIANGFIGLTVFSDGSTAANATFINNGGTASGGFGGETLFVGGTATAANGTFINNGGTTSGAQGGFTEFNGGTAANGTFINNGGTTSGAQGGFTEFFGTAGNGTFINKGGTTTDAQGGFTEFFLFGTAANGTFINKGGTTSGAQGGFTEFFDASTAGSATIIANSGIGGGQGGGIFFKGFSDGGTSRVEVFGNGSLDISGHLGLRGLTVGSVEGDGNVFLGAQTLTVGSNDLSTTFSGAIQDGGQNGGVGGSLTKIGSGTLILSGANTYTGDTKMNRGVLQVDGSITSNTFVNGGTLAGRGTINGNVTNKGRVSPGSAGAPGMLTIVGNYTQAQYATLMIELAGANTDDFSVLNILGTANLNGFLNPVLFNGFVPAVGDSFPFLNYASFTGAFSKILNQVFNHGTEQWSVIYQNNNAILTVESHTPGVPDHGSTFLLLMLGLLGLVAFRRQLLRGHT